MVRVARLELDPLTPSQVRYQLRYTRFSIRCSRSQLSYNSMFKYKLQHFFSFFSKFLLRQISESLLTNPI